MPRIRHREWFSFIQSTARTRFTQNFSISPIVHSFVDKYSTPASSHIIFSRGYARFQFSIFPGEIGSKRVMKTQLSLPFPNKHGPETENLYLVKGKVNWRDFLHTLCSVQK